MKEINLGRKLMEKRHEKGVTQDELASYIGVSKASVSKWETAQSYPDITFLPQLAAYFNISIDELMGYKPQMAKEDIKRLYHRLSKDFSLRPFDEVLEECDIIIKKYYSCFPLLLQMALLLINHHMLVQEIDKQKNILTHVLDLCKRISTESDDVWIVRDAVSIETACYLMLGQPEKVISLLGEDVRPFETNTEILAQALAMTGKTDKADEALQISVYQHLMIIMNDAPLMLQLNSDNPEKVSEILQRTLSVAQIFKIEKLQPSYLVQLYLCAAQIFCTCNDKQKAIEMLECYTKLCVDGFFPCTLHGDEYFDKISDWFESFDLGNAAPRSEKIIKESMLEGITKNPYFEILKDTVEYKGMLKRIKSII